MFYPHFFPGSLSYIVELQDFAIFDYKSCMKYLQIKM